MLPMVNADTNMALRARSMVLNWPLIVDAHLELTHRKGPAIPS